MRHRFGIRVYYEDTDLAGIVYYANYLKFIERGRSEWVRASGVDQAGLRREEGVVFAVRRLVAEYHRPGHYDDVLEVRTELQAVSGARISLLQSVWRGADLLFEAEVVLVCLALSGRATRIPAAVRGLLAGEKARDVT